MSKAKRKKTTHIDTDNAEQEKEKKPGDIYDDKKREEIRDEQRALKRRKWEHACKRTI